jgi:hypothetical protein
MAVDWEATFRDWKKPSSDTEAAKMENAERMIRDAIRGCPILAQRTIEIFAQGSYRNNTNVRQDSDVDICVRCMDYSFDDFTHAGGVQPVDIGRYASSYTYAQFKSEVGTALVKKFGEKGVTRGSKAYDVHANSYRIDADVVAVLEHRMYFKDWRGQLDYQSGAEFHPDTGGQIINWPNQHYQSGVAKNQATGSRFKYITRCIKRLRYLMADKGIAAAKPIPSYLVECLVWNAPDKSFGHDEYVSDVRDVLAHAYNNTRQHDLCDKWMEVNGIKFLFHWSQPWTRQQAFDFVSAAWDYVGLQ